jgi:hypothetical protein
MDVGKAIQKVILIDTYRQQKWWRSGRGERFLCRDRRWLGLLLNRGD